MIFLVLIFGQVFFVGNQVSLGELVFNTEKAIDQEKLEGSELEKEIAVKSSYFSQASLVVEVKNTEVALKK